jgi:hypothetical protein
MGIPLSILKYFEVDDGSLPEIVVAFPDSVGVARAFEYLFNLGARDVTAGGGRLWLVASQSEVFFSGSTDAVLVASGDVEPFHVVLTGVTFAKYTVPDLGVFIDTTSLVLDYRMGSVWKEAQIASLFSVLRTFRDFGGVLSVPWWGADDERTFLDGLDAA